MNKIENLQKLSVDTILSLMKRYLQVLWGCLKAVISYLKTIKNSQISQE